MLCVVRRWQPDGVQYPNNSPASRDFTKQGDSQQIQSVISRKISQLRENKSKLDEAFVYQKMIDQETYNGMRAQLAEELALGEMELREAQAEEIEIETVLDYAQMLFNERIGPVESRASRAETALPPSFLRF